MHTPRFGKRRVVVYGFRFQQFEDIDAPLVVALIREIGKLPIAKAAKPRG